MKINICGIPHEIVECVDVFNADAIHFGEIDYMKCEIKINANMPDESKRETLCHEILHGMLVHLGYNDISNDEQFVQALANAINQTFDVKVGD